jgi:hypothetical protein
LTLAKTSDGHLGQIILLLLLRLEHSFSSMDRPQVIIEATLSVQAKHTVTKIFTNIFARYEAKKFSYWTIQTRYLSQ